MELGQTRRNCAKSLVCTVIAVILCIIFYLFINHVLWKAFASTQDPSIAKVIVISEEAMSFVLCAFCSFVAATGAGNSAKRALVSGSIAAGLFRAPLPSILHFLGNSVSVAVNPSLREPLVILFYCGIGLVMGGLVNYLRNIE